MNCVAPRLPIQEKCSSLVPRGPHGDPTLWLCPRLCFPDPSPIVIWQVNPPQFFPGKVRAVWTHWAWSGAGLFKGSCLLSNSALYWVLVYRKSHGTCAGMEDAVEKLCQKPWQPLKLAYWLGVNRAGDLRIVDTSTGLDYPLMLLYNRTMRPLGL